jgi:transcriptional regulator with XRE-family HTH domain
MLLHNQLRSKILSKVPVRRAYDELAEEFSIIEKLVRARLQSGLSQAEVAERMGTQAPAISRIESQDSKHSPSLRTLQKYAAAVGCDLKVQLKQRKPAR